MRVVEGSAFVAAPLGGMTLAQLGADVIRFDPIGGGLDRNRWPVTDDGKSLFWAGLNKGKRSIQVDLGSARARARCRADHRARARRGPVPDQLPGPRLARLRAPCGTPRRPDHGQHHRQLRRHSSAVDYTVNPATGFPGRPARATSRCPSTTCCRPGTRSPAGWPRPGCWRPSAPRADRRGPAGAVALSDVAVRDGRQPRQDRRGADQPPRAPEGRQLPLRRLRPRLPDQGRPADHDRRADLRQWRSLVEATGGRGVRDARADDGRGPRQGGRPLRRARGDRRDPEALDDGPARWTRSARSSTATGSAGAPTRRSWSWSRRTRAARPRTRCSRRSSSRGSAPT